MTLIRDTGVGKFDADVAQVMTEVRQPVFVDNAVHHALVNSQSSSKHKVTIENRNNATYAVATENTFNIVEGESSIQVENRDTAAQQHHSLKMNNYLLLRKYHLYFTMRMTIPKD